MTVAVALSPAPVRRARPGVRRALMAGASVLLHVAILGPMILLAASEDHPPREPPPPPVIQLEIQPRALPPEPIPQPRPREPEPTPVPVEPLPAPTPSTQASPSPAVMPAPLPIPQPAPQAAPQRPPSPQPQVLTAPKPIAAPTLTPAPLPAPAPVPVPAPAPSPPAAAERATPAPAPVTAIRPRKKDEDEARDGLPAPPAPRIAAPVPGAPTAAAAGVPGVSDAWRFAPEGQAGRNARVLRTSPAGCRSTEILSRSEQAVCDERFNARAAEGAARGAITGSGDPARDARFAREGAREMQRYEAQRRPLSGGAGVVGPADCPGSNFGTGCAGAHLDSSMQMDSTRNIQTRRDGPAASGRPSTPGAAAPREPQ